MFNIISPHLGDRWKKIQREFIEKNTKEQYNYIVYDVPDNCKHLRSLGRCLIKLSQVSNEEDICVILDSDAFPISFDWTKVVLESLNQNKLNNNEKKDYDFIAVQRLENPNQYRFIAHPCFCAWYHGTQIVFKEIMRNPFIEGYKTRRWKKLHRTNTINYHQQLFAIYGDVIYHHGAGSRNVTNQRFFKVNEKVDEPRFFRDPQAFINELI